MFMDPLFAAAAILGPQAAATHCKRLALAV